MSGIEVSVSMAMPSLRCGTPPLFNCIERGGRLREELEKHELFVLNPTLEEAACILIQEVDVAALHASGEKDAVDVFD
jgi:hypothetical protein